MICLYCLSTDLKELDAWTCQCQSCGRQLLSQKAWPAADEHRAFQDGIEAERHEQSELYEAEENMEWSE